MDRSMIARIANLSDAIFRERFAALKVMSEQGSQRSAAMCCAMNDIPQCA